MRRVLTSGGRLGLNVFSQSIGYQIFECTAAQFVGEKAAAIMREPFALADLDELSGLLRTAELSTVQMYTKTLPAPFASADDFIDYQLGGRLANAERATASGAQMVSEEDLFRTADILSVHLRRSEMSHNL